MVYSFDPSVFHLVSFVISESNQIAFLRRLKDKYHPTNLVTVIERCATHIDGRTEVDFLV